MTSRRPEIVLFACAHNAGRSQMAAALFNALADPLRARAISAGTQPIEQVHPEVVAVMLEVGIDLSGIKPQRLTDTLARSADLLVTMGCGPECPTVPGQWRNEWVLMDPRGEHVGVVRAIRDFIRHRVEGLIAAHGWRR